MGYVWRFEQLVQDYHDEYAAMTFDPGFEATIRKNAARILRGQQRYEVVASKTSIPWFFIGIIHCMESTCDFSTHLHNGDPLTARTRQVPANRPPGEPKAGGSTYSWEESAIDALTMPGKELDKIRVWSVERMAYQFECYNGQGYLNHHPKDKSPYLWAQTSINDGKGKYKYDGKWVENMDANGQSGAMALLKQLTDQLGLEFPEEPLLSGDSTQSLERDRKTVEAVQRQLTAIGFPCGKIDGIWVARGLTAQAIASSKVANHWEPADSSITPEYLAALMTWGPQELSAERQNMTVKDLKERGSTTIAITDVIKKGTIAAVGTGAASEATKVTGVTDSLPDLTSVQSQISQISEWQSVLYSISGMTKTALKFAQDNPLLIIVVCGVAVYFYMNKLQKDRLEKARSGLDVSK